MKNVGQIGFDFGDVSPAYRLDADWTWKEKPRSMREHMARLATAKAALDKLVGIPHAVFSEVLSGVLAEHDRQVAWCHYDEKSDDEKYTLWGHATTFTEAEYETLITHCTKHDGQTVEGVEYKVRTSPSTATGKANVYVAMHATGIGSILISRCSGRDGTWHTMRFTHIERDSFFLPSYEDDAQYEYCSGTVWGPAYSAQLIAEAHKKIASVRTFKFGGREYVNTGASYCGDYSQCSAWAIIAAEEWTGDTFSYAEMTQAWDRGASERGDMRGLLVRVRGQLCVLEKYMTVYDTQRRPIVITSSDEEENAPDHDDLVDEGVDEAEMEEDALYA